jgi:hypothetical protein
MHRCRMAQTEQRVDVRGAVIGVRLLRRTVV